MDYPLGQSTMRDGDRTMNSEKKLKNVLLYIYNWRDVNDLSKLDG